MYPSVLKKPRNFKMISTGIISAHQVGCLGARPTRQTGGTEDLRAVLDKSFEVENLNTEVNAVEIDTEETTRSHIRTAQARARTRRPSTNTQTSRCKSRTAGRKEGAETQDQTPLAQPDALLDQLQMTLRSFGQGISRAAPANTDLKVRTSGTAVQKPFRFDLDRGQGLQAHAQPDSRRSHTVHLQLRLRRSKVRTKATVMQPSRGGLPFQTRKMQILSRTGHVAASGQPRAPLPPADRILQLHTQLHEQSQLKHRWLQLERYRNPSLEQFARDESRDFSVCNETSQLRSSRDNRDLASLKGRRRPQVPSVIEIQCAPRKQVQVYESILKSRKQAATVTEPGPAAQEGVPRTAQASHGGLSKEPSKDLRSAGTSPRATAEHTRAKTQGRPAAAAEPTPQGRHRTHFVNHQEIL